MSKFRRNGFWLRIVCVVLLLVAGCLNQVQTAEPPPPSSFHEAAEKDFGSWPDRIIEESEATFSKSDNFTALLLAGGASIAMHNSDADKNLAGNFEKHGGFRELTDKGLDIVGGPGFHFAATGLWYAISAGKGDEFNTRRSWTMMTALAITGLSTVSLKAIRRNDTPNGKSWAWPSGHTSSSFAVASVLDEFYGPEVGVPAYIMASLVGWRMMDSGDHWGSDVVFGATLGWIVGHTVAGRHKELELAGFRVLPYTGYANGSVVGISLVKQF